MPPIGVRVIPGPTGDLIRAACATYVTLSHETSLKSKLSINPRIPNSLKSKLSISPRIPKRSGGALVFKIVQISKYPKCDLTLILWERVAYTKTARARIKGEPVWPSGKASGW